MSNTFPLTSDRKVILHIAILLTATVVSLVWVTSEKLSNFSLQLTAILLLTFIFTHRLLNPPSFKLAESTISAMAVLLVSSSTGGITSPLFFLNYFLLFELSFLLEPVIPLALSGALMLFYFFTADANVSLFQYIELSAFPLMTPLSYFFGKFYRKEENQKQEIKNLEKKVEELEEELVEEELK